VNTRPIRPPRASPFLPNAVTPGGEASHNQRVSRERIRADAARLSRRQNALSTELTEQKPKCCLCVLRALRGGAYLRGPRRSFGE